MFQNIGTTEIIIIAVVLMVLFGAKKLPEFARGLGESGRELKKASKELRTAITDDDDDDKKS
jgi:sec-independent protein translocase protein TatA